MPANEWRIGDEAELWPLSAKIYAVGLCGKGCLVEANVRLFEKFFSLD